MSNQNKKEIKMANFVSALNELKEIGDKEFKGWTKKLKEINKKYGILTRISFMFDKWNLLGYKDSPIDCGQETFLKLWKERIKL